jgi:hypothetical protein
MVSTFRTAPGVGSSALAGETWKGMRSPTSSSSIEAAMARFRC